VLKQWNLNHFERVAGVFVACALLGILLVFAAIGIRKGWFESKIIYFTEIEDSEGLRGGSAVQLAGIRVGEVVEIDMNRSNLIRVKIAVLRRFRDRIRTGTRIQLIRPYVVGEKALYLFTPIDGTQVLPELSLIPAEEVVGLTELLNGRKFMPYVQTLGNIFNELKQIADLLLKKNDSKKMAGVVERLPEFLAQVGVLTKELTLMTRQLNDGGNLKKVVRGLAQASDTLSASMPQVAEMTPKLARDLTVVVGNLAVLTEEFKKVLPALAEVAPELPKSSHRMVEALDEAVVVLKAMQKSFLLRGSAKEVREEEAIRELEKNRVPASAP